MNIQAPLLTLASAAIVVPQVAATTAQPTTAQVTKINTTPAEDVLIPKLVQEKIVVQRVEGLETPVEKKIDIAQSIKTIEEQNKITEGILTEVATTGKLLSKATQTQLVKHSSITTPTNFKRKTIAPTTLNFVTPSSWESNEWKQFYLRLKARLFNLLTISSSKTSEQIAFSNITFPVGGFERINLGEIASKCPESFCLRKNGTSQIEKFYDSLDAKANTFYSDEIKEKSQIKRDDFEVENCGVIFTSWCDPYMKGRRYVYSSDGGEDFWEEPEHRAGLMGFDLSQEMLSDPKQQDKNFLFVDNLAKLFSFTGEIAFGLRTGQICDSLGFHEGTQTGEFLLAEGLENFRVGIYGKREGELTTKTEHLDNEGGCAAAMGGGVCFTNWVWREKKSETSPYSCNFISDARTTLMDVFPKSITDKPFWGREGWKKIEKKDRTTIFLLYYKYLLQKKAGEIWRFQYVTAEEKFTPAKALQKIDKIFASWSDEQWRAFLDTKNPFQEESIKKDWRDFWWTLHKLVIRAKLESFAAFKRNTIIN